MEINQCWRKHYWQDKAQIHILKLLLIQPILIRDVNHEIFHIKSCNSNDSLCLCFIAEFPFFHNLAVSQSQTTNTLPTHIAILVQLTLEQGHLTSALFDRYVVITF